MNKRINIVLPEATVRTIDKMAKPGHRSRFIDQAVQHFVANKSAEALRAQLERSAIRDRDLDQNFIADWSALDQASWQQLETSEQQRKPATRDGEKSTSRRSIPSLGQR
jgi:CopG family transcriptional regulator/antitoxin EndoAI